MRCRSTAGRWPLKPVIVVRVHAPQPWWKVWAQMASPLVLKTSDFGLGSSTLSPSESGPVAELAYAAASRAASSGGSNPSRPTIFARVGELAYPAGRGPAAWRFESAHAHHRAVVKLAKAPRSDRGDFVGSTPTCPTIFNGAVAQRRRHLAVNQTHHAEVRVLPAPPYGERPARRGSRPLSGCPARGLGCESPALRHFRSIDATHTAWLRFRV